LSNEMGSSQIEMRKMDTDESIDIIAGKGRTNVRLNFHRRFKRFKSSDCG
jgi:hypothetical protein